MRRHDGAYRWFKAQGHLIPSPGGMPGRWIGTIVDVHALKEAQAALQERERELRTVADNSPDIIVRFDRALRHVFINAAVERVTGKPMALFLGRTNRELGMPADAVRAVGQRDPQGVRRAPDRSPRISSSRWKAACATSRPAGAGDRRNRRRRPRARRHPRRHRRLAGAGGVAPRRPPEGRFPGHARARAAQPARTAAHRPERAAARPVRGRQQRVRQIMERQLDHMVRLVDELLDIARISQGKVVLRARRCRWRLVLEHAVDAGRPLLDAQGHTLVWHGVDPAWQVHGDITRLAQVVGNLLNNAAKYTPPGGRVTLSAVEEGNDLRITVEDTGVGIPRDMLARVFDRFVQAEQHLDRAQGGLGIGLSVVRALVEMHGGRVGAESAGPGWAAASACLVAACARPAGADRGARPAAARPCAPKRVLIVDDNQDAAETLAMVVQFHGHEIPWRATARRRWWRPASTSPTSCSSTSACPA
jgi:PAS domain-containing protein